MRAESDLSIGAAGPKADRRSVEALRQEPQSQAALAAEVVTVLAGMTFEERVRAYRSGAISAHELAVAAARLPDEVPLLNDEFEWIAISLE